MVEELEVLVDTTRQVKMNVIGKERRKYKLEVFRLK